MKIQFVSDLHLENYRYKQPTLAVIGDILVLAGDIDNGTAGLEYACRHSSLFDHVLYIPGNHEFYSSEYNKVLKELGAYVTPSNVHLLLGTSIKIEGVYFYGNTLWSHILPHEKEVILGCLNDYYAIKHCYKPITIEGTNMLHKIAKASLRTFLYEKKGKKVVITHHLPSFSVIDSKYSASKINAAFASSTLDDAEIKPDLWICGHSHSSIDTVIDKCRVVANPRGYVGWGGEIENAQYNECRIVEI